MTPFTFRVGFDVLNILYHRLPSAAPPPNNIIIIFPMMRLHKNKYIMKLIFDPETGFNNSIVNAVIERVVCDDGFDDLIITTVEIAGDSEPW